jgi:hypothetical protein
MFEFTCDFHFLTEMCYSEFITIWYVLCGTLLSYISVYSLLLNLLL